MEFNKELLFKGVLQSKDENQVSPVISNLNAVHWEVCTEVITDLYSISSLSPLKFQPGMFCFAQSIIFANVPFSAARITMECLD